MTDKDVNLDEQLAKLKEQLAASERKATEAEAEAEKKDKEARRHQKERDKLQAALTQQTVSRQPPRTPDTKNTPAPRVSQVLGRAGSTEANEALRAFANEQAKEVARLRTMIENQLTEEDIEDIEFETPQELATQIEIIKQKKEIAALKAQVEQRIAEETSGPRIDTGGPTKPGKEGQGEQVQALRTRAVDLRKQGRYQEATWVVLHASHQDPKKRLLHIPGEEQQ